MDLIDPSTEDHNYVSIPKDIDKKTAIRAL